MNRREFAGAAGAAMLALGARADDLDDLYNRAIVIDSLSIETWDAGGFDAAKRSGYTAIQTSLSNANFTVAMRDLQAWKARFDEHPGQLIRCEKAADIRRAKTEGKLAIMLGFQNGTILESNIANLNRLYAAGARCIQLTYNARNLLGDGCTERTNAGLSDFGLEAVAKMDELGIIVDLSHCGDQTSADGIAFAKRAPCFTHTMCQSIYFHPRAKSDALLRAMANRGGMTGIVALGYFVGPRPDTSLEDYLNHIDRAVKVCGIEHVGLSTDFNIRGIETTATKETWLAPRLREFKASYNVRWPPWVPELDKPDRFRNVSRGLAKRGYKTADVEKILGGNWLRYLQEFFGA
jgi:membrane dipeptidase